MYEKKKKMLQLKGHEKKYFAAKNSWNKFLGAENP